MFKKIGMVVMVCLVSLSLSGCFLLLAGTAGGAGTSVWLGGKLTQEFHSSYDRAIDAAKKALQSLHLEVIKESKEAAITQLKSRYTDGREIWIDIRKITEDSTKIEVRVGMVSQKDAAAKILKRIEGYL